MFGVLCQIATERGARCFENVAITATAPEKYTMPNDAAKPDWHDRPTEPGLTVNGTHLGAKTRLSVRL